MNKPQLVSKAGEVLRNNGVKRSVSVPDCVLYVMDDLGNKKKFTVSVPDREVSYTNKDVANVLDAVFAVVEDAIKHGEEVHLYGMGSLKLSKREAGMMQVPGRDEWFEVPEHYIPYFKIGDVIKHAARFYDSVVAKSKIADMAPVYDACESEDYE